MNLSHRRQRLVVLVVLFALVAAVALWPTPDRESDSAHAGPAVACDTSPAPLTGLVNGNTLSLGNGTTITPCIAKAPIHMRIGYTDGETGGAAGGPLDGGTAFTTDGISFPDGKYTRLRTDCGPLGGKSDSTIAKPTILQFADGSQSAGPSNVTTYATGFGCNETTLYAQNGWPTGFDKSDDKMLIHMRLKNLQIRRDAFLTVTPQGANASRLNPSSGTGEYKLTFIPQTQSSADWNIGDECVYTDLWLTADTYIKTNILNIATTVGSLAGDDSLWGSILGTIAGLDNIPGLQLDGWVYYMNTNKGTDCAGSPTTLNLPNTNITVTP